MIYFVLIILVINSVNIILYNCPAVIAITNVPPPICVYAKERLFPSRPIRLRTFCGHWFIKYLLFLVAWLICYFLILGPCVGLLADISFGNWRLKGLNYICIYVFHISISKKNYINYRALQRDVCPRRH